jgi:hypothetical protein
VRDPADEKKTAFLKEIAATANAADRLALYKVDSDWRDCVSSL